MLQCASENTMQNTINCFRTRLAAAAAALLLIAAGNAWADPPARAIRLAYTSGAVSFLPSGESGWVEARINRPLWTGDRLWSDRGARAELQIGGAVLFFAPETSVSILNFDDQRAQFEVTQGTLDVYVRTLGSDDAIEIDTPNLAFVVRRPGQYRIDVRPDGDSTLVAVERGEGEAFGKTAAYVLGTGQRFRFYGTELSDYEADASGRRDAFDTFVAERVRYQEQSVSARYVSAETIGYADLDAYGTWRTVANYGPVWVPTRVDAGWAPYRYGHWAWVDPWGWTWVDDAQWGFAPFHYGRWAYVDNRYWGWVPGPRNVCPVYAPALVAFIGGSNFRVSVSSGPTAGIAWFPLAPGEVYRPAYTASRDYFTRVNVTNTVVNVTSVTNVYNNPARTTDVRYANVNNVNAVTAVPAQTFVQAQPVQRAALRVDSASLQQARVIAAAPIAPARASIVGAAAAAQAKPAPQVIERPVVAKATPPAPPPSIERRQEMMKQQPGKPLDSADLARIAPAATAKPNVTVVESAPAGKPIPPAAARTAEPGKTPPQVAQPAPTAPGVRAQTPPPAAKGEGNANVARPEPARPEAAAKGPAPSPVTAPKPVPESTATRPEPARPTQALPAPEAQQRTPQEAQIQPDMRRVAPPRDTAQRAPQPPAVAAPTIVAPPNVSPPPAAKVPPAENARVPQSATAPPTGPPPRVGQAEPQAPPTPRAAQQPQTQPPREARSPAPVATPPTEATHAPPPPQAQSGRQAERETAKAPPGKADQREKSDKAKREE
jgi:hypothetical protein